MGASSPWLIHNQEHSTTLVTKAKAIYIKESMYLKVKEE
jgi:hypothetical protein